MPGGSPFLTTEDFARFSQPGRFHKRYVVVRPSNQHDVAPASQELTSMAANTVKAISTDRTNSFRCHCVSVRTDDGMSWTAESLRQRVVSAHPQFVVVGLATRENPDIPHVTELIGERGLLQAAVKHKLAKWYPTLYISQAALVIAGLGAAGLLVAIGSAVQKITTPSTMAAAGAFRNPLFLSMTAALTLLGVISKILADRFSPGQKEASVKLLKERLNECERLTADHQAPRHYIDFIEELARKLQLIERPRVVIVDNYERLDPTSRAVIEQYFRVQRVNANGSEYWLILELPNGQNFSNVIGIDRERYEQNKFELLKQLPLSAKAIFELTQTLGSDEVPPGSTVKWICCGGIPQNDHNVLTFLRKHREDHPADPEQYGDLEFFYLVSIASAPMETTFSRRELVSILIKGEQRLPILKILFKNTDAGTELARGEFELKLNNIRREFSPFLESLSKDDFRPDYESAKTLESKAATFGLKDVGLVHLYWAFCWFDLYQNQAPQAFVIRKLNYHLLRANVSGIPNGSRKSAVNHIFDAFLYAIDSSVKTCVFTDLSELVAKAATFYTMKDREERGNSQDRLLRRCWDTFSVLGDEQTLSTILQLQEVNARTQLDSESESVGLGALTELFLEVVPMDRDSRDAIRMAFRNWGDRRSYENGEAARRNADACAGWLITSIAPLLDPMSIQETLLGRALESCDTLPALFRETYAKLERQRSSVPMLTDVMTLSLCLWSATLRIEEDFSFDRVQLVTEMAHEALIVATEINGRTSGPQMEVVVHALSTELAGVALASLLTSFMLMNRASAAEPESETLMKRLVTDGLQTIGKRSRPEVTDLTSLQLLAEVDSYLSLSATMWIQFGLDRLRDFAYLRRMQFNFICRGISPADHLRTQPLLETVSPALAGSGATGVLSNACVSNCLRTTNDLSTRYLNRAALISFNDGFESGFQNGIAIMTIYHGHALGLNLERPLKMLLREDSDGKASVRKLFTHLSDELVSDYALRFLNASDSLQDQAAVAEVEHVVTDAANLIPKDDERDRILSLLQLHTLKRKARRGDTLPSEEELLASWSNRKESWMFAAVMNILIHNGHPKDNHWDMAHSLLEHDPATDLTSSYFTLAMTVGEHFDEIGSKHKNRDTVLRYISRSLPRWERFMAAETNLRAYQLLVDLDGKNGATYDSGVKKWQKIKIERDHLALLPELLKNKRYFLIFNEYYFSARFWGLHDDGTAEQWHEFRRADTAKRKEDMRIWIEGGAEIPAPLQGRDKSQVSARFLWIGHRLFSPPFYDDPKYAGDRDHFNKAAMDSIKDLRKAILQLPSMPAELREVLAYHSKQLLSYDGLIEENKRVA